MSRAIKTNFLIFLVLKDKKFCFFPSRNPQGFSFVTFFSVSLFTFLGCFHFSPILGVFIFHLSQVFPFFSFLKCFIFHLFQCFLIHLSRVFSFFTFLGCFQFSPFLRVSHCVISVQIRSFRWTVFSLYLVRIQENTDQKKLRICLLFT